MSTLIIDGHVLRKAIIAGANTLNSSKDEINALNVFPVPDGDTGINMTMTVLVAAKEVEKVNTSNIYEIAKIASSGSLRGARGNSGVILSQLFRGFAKGLEGKNVATIEDLCSAFVKAVEFAYRAVMKPKEGTILTVAKAISESALEISFDENDIDLVLNSVLEQANKVLLQTQFMLPELKQAGVIDAGGKGLLTILEGALNAKYLPDDISVNSNIETGNTSPVNSKNAISNASGDIKFAYCTEFFVVLENSSDKIEKDLKSFLEKNGDSIVVVADDDIIKVHVHTNHPGKVLEKALTFGHLSRMKIENMKEQHTNIVNVEEEKKVSKKDYKELGFISVSVGKGLTEMFKSIGVDYVVEGGQTMNPSTEDILKAVDSIPANNIIILPNNSNIILAAEQAAKLSTDKKVFVIPTKTIPQGITAMLNHLEDLSLEDNLQNMNNSISTVQTGQVTYSIRDTVVDDIEISKGDILCMLDGKISNVSKSILDGTKELIDNMISKNKDAELISIYYGEDQTDENVNILKDYIEEKYEDMEIELFNGGQPLYHYIISVE